MVRARWSWWRLGRAKVRLGAGLASTSMADHEWDQGICRGGYRPCISRVPTTSMADHEWDQGSNRSQPQAIQAGQREQVGCRRLMLAIGECQYMCEGRTEQGLQEYSTVAALPGLGTKAESRTASSLLGSPKSQAPCSRQAAASGLRTP